MAYSSGEGGYGASASVFHFDAARAEGVSISDPELLFKGHYGRSGPDLVLTGQNGHRHIVPGYFATEKHPALVAPNGAHLSGDLVDLLSGSRTPGQYAQAQTTAPADTIGKIEKVVGTVDVVRNGVTVALHVGDAVHKSDVIETGADSSCGVSFPDGTALNLVANTRMALNDYSFDAGSTSSNGALFTLVEGTFAFVAGAVAHTGDMKIGTPVATMGIRGTTGILGTNIGEVFFLLRDDYHTNHHGILELIEFGITISDTDYVTYCTTGSCRQQPVTNSQRTLFGNIIDQLDEIIDRSNNPNPKSDHVPGSGDNPNLLLPIVFPILEGTPPPINVHSTGAQDGPPSSSDLANFGALLMQPGAPSSNVFIWNSLGTTSPWPTNVDWNQGAPPTQPDAQVVIQAGTLIYNLPVTTKVSFLTVDAGATLEITSGELIPAGLIDNGTIIVVGDPPTFVVNGPVEVASGGKIIDDSGTILYENGLITVDAAAGGKPAGIIVSLGSSSVIDFTNDTVDNSGRIEADHGGEVSFYELNIENERGANIAADGWGSEVRFDRDHVDSSGRIAAEHGGEVSFYELSIDNRRGAEIASDGWGSEVKFDRDHVDNFGLIEAENGGQVDFWRSSVDNRGTIGAKFGGILDVESFVDNTHGSISVSDCGVAYFAQCVTGGTATVQGGTLIFGAASNVAVAFDNGASGTDYGALILGDWWHFSGEISGFTGTAGNAASSDEVELLNFSGPHLHDFASFDSSTDITTLTVWNSHELVSLKFVGDYTTCDFTVTQAGCNVEIFDPPAANPPGPSVSITGPGNDTFVFQPGSGAETIANFNPRADTIELDHFANVQNVRELTSLISNDGHGGAFIQLDHSDSIDIPGVTASYLQAHLQSLVHLH